MPNTDLSNVTKHHKHTLVSLRKPLRCGFAIVLCSCLFYGAAQCRAQEASSQDVAEAARQERARREQEQPKHVYTDEDLRRAKILTPEDEARLAAKRKLDPTAPVQQPTPDALDASGELGQLPLGDIARYYRRAKLATQPAFLLPFDEPEFASPVQPIEVKPDFASPVAPRIVRPHPKAAAAPAISSPAPVQRRDPFSRRLLPARPSTPRVFSAPTPVPSSPAVVTPAPAIAQPGFSAKSAVPSIAAVPAPPVSLATANPAAVKPAIVNPAAPISGVQTIVVQRGDSLWKIAERTLGRGSRWREVLAANPTVVSPEALKAGMQLTLPFDVRAPRAEKVKVNAGDTLTKIAQAQYGRANYWRCIAQANPDITDANRIFEGQELRLPSRCKPSFR